MDYATIAYGTATGTQVWVMRDDGRPPTRWPSAPPGAPCSSPVRECTAAGTPCGTTARSPTARRTGKRLWTAPLRRPGAAGRLGRRGSGEPHRREPCSSPGHSPRASAPPPTTPRSPTKADPANIGDAASARNARLRPWRGGLPDRAGHGRPAHQHGEAARGAADHDVGRGPPLQPDRVDEDVEQDGGVGQIVRGQPVDQGAEQVAAAPRTMPKMSASNGLTTAIGAGRASGRRENRASWRRCRGRCSS